MDIINSMFPDLIEFLADKKLDLVFVIKLIDYIFNSLELSIDDEVQVTSYIHNVKIVNNLYMLFSLTRDFEPIELNAFNNDVVQDLLDNPSRIEKFKEFRVKTLEKHSSDLVPMFQEYRGGKF